MNITNEELRRRFNPDGSTLRKAQLRMLEMLTFLDEICKKNNITYWIDSGTLLGAVRHGGFIPWDDDVDIAMPYKDVIKLRKLMTRCSFSDEFVFQCRKTDPYFYQTFDKLTDTNSKYILNDDFFNIRKYTGLQIDIFPMIRNNINLFHRLCTDYKHYFISSYRRRKMSREKIPFGLKFHYFTLTKIIVPTFKLISDILPQKDYMTYFYGIEFNDKLLVKNIFPLKRVEFEGHFFNAPFNCDGYLSNIYGDWRQLPPLNTLHKHSDNIILQ